MASMMSTVPQDDDGVRAGESGEGRHVDVSEGVIGRLAGAGDWLGCLEETARQAPDIGCQARAGRVPSRAPSQRQIPASRGRDASPPEAGSFENDQCQVTEGNITRRQIAVYYS